MTILKLTALTLAAALALCGPAQAKDEQDELVSVKGTAVILAFQNHCGGKFKLESTMMASIALSRYGEAKLFAAMLEVENFRRIINDNAIFCATIQAELPQR